MEQWLLYGLISSLAFGINVIFYKIALEKGFSPYMGFILFGIGVLTIGLIGIILSQPSLQMNTKSIFFSLVAGLIWGIGGLLVGVALSKGASASRLAPILNTNTLVAVLLGIIVLKEIPNASTIVRIIIGSVFIIIGSVLVSL